MTGEKCEDFEEGCDYTRENEFWPTETSTLVMRYKAKSIPLDLQTEVAELAIRNLSFYL